MSRDFSQDKGYVPFSNGTEHMMWLDSNCSRGEHGCRHYKPEASSSRHGCPIEVAVALAGGHDDGIPIRIAVRGGFLEPGPRGTLIEPVSGESPGAKVIPVCPEFKGYDEPDDRPRRGPRAPEGQMDLLDPRNVPERERVG